MKCIIVWYRMPLDVIFISCLTGWVTVTSYWLLKQHKYFPYTRTGGPAEKLVPSNHDCPIFRLEPYIWTYIFMLYFILSYMLGLCLRDIYVYLLAQVGFRLWAPNLHSALQSWHQCTCRYFKSCDCGYAVVIFSPYVVILYILAILLESAGSEEREQFDVGDYSAVWSELHYFQTSTGWSRIYIMYCTLPKVLVQVH